MCSYDNIYAKNFQAVPDHSLVFNQNSSCGRSQAKIAVNLSQASSVAHLHAQGEALWIVIHLVNARIMAFPVSDTNTAGTTLGNNLSTFAETCTSTVSSPATTVIPVTTAFTPY